MDEGRLLELVGANNARDLGDLTTKDGSRTVRGRVLRSDFLVSLDPGDERLLLSEIGLRRVVDLRTIREVETFPGPWGATGVDLVLAPLPLDPAFVATDFTHMVQLYLSFLEPLAVEFVRAVSAVLDTDRHPVLIHCAAGKDRTGVLVALLLEFLGVERSVIGVDYELSQSCIVAVASRLERETGRKLASTAPEVMRLARASTIETFLGIVEERYGGARAWAMEQGIAAGAIERFRAAMLRKPT